jgi:hypothetical protein
MLYMTCRGRYLISPDLLQSSHLRCCRGDHRGVIKIFAFGDVMSRLLITCFCCGGYAKANQQVKTTKIGLGSHHRNPSGPPL